jgi:16S rRNA (guanine966-N2)-methyltransferase
VGGNASGQRLCPPKSRHVRPTGERVRESLFQILGALDGACVVDAFGGTGALGCEALSRGAEHVYFFESNRSAVEVITENVRRIGANERTTIQFGDFFRRSASIEEPIDLWFVDPPYHKGLSFKALEIIALHPMAGADTLVVVERDRREEDEGHSAFDEEDLRDYGDTRILFLRKI